MAAEIDSKLLDAQYLDFHFGQFYLITWPDCQQFDEIDDVDNVVFPTVAYGMPASFVSKELIEQLIEENGL